MAISKPFDELLTYTRDSGGTRVNAAGLIVGVDFSTTSVTFGTGAKTFTLAADANVNRDWPVGSRIRATSQASPLGVMNGTVTSYDPALQELVINVTESTGTGTGTNWRIGSLEFRRDFDPVTLAAKGGLVEGGATNLATFSDDVTNAAWIRDGIVSGSSIVSPSGKNDFFLLSENNLISFHTFARGIPVPVGPFYISFYIKAEGRNVFRLFTNFAGNQSTVFDLTTGLITASDNQNTSITSVGGGVYKVRRFGTSIGGNAFIIRFKQDGDATISEANESYQGDGVSGFRIWGVNIASGSGESHNPTTTVAVSRAADLPAVDGDNFTQAYNQSQGTLLVECIPTDSVNSSAIASINDGTLDNEIRVGQKQSGTRSSIRAIASDGVTDVMGLNATGNNIVRSNGVDYTEADTGQVANGFAVASAGVGQFIVGGTNGLYSITDDGGATWDNFQLDVADRAQINGAAFGNGVYVLVGNAVGGSGLIVTVDPVTGAYTRRVSGFTVSALNCRFISGAFYATTASGIYRSADNGVTWTQVQTQANIQFSGIAGDGTTIVATRNANGQIATSIDNGLTFTAATNSGATAAALRNIAQANGLFVAVGSTGVIITSASGLAGTWALRASGVTVDLYTVHYSTRDQQWYAAGDNGTILRSSDTITWESIANDAVGAVLANGVIQSNPFLDNLIPNQVNTIAMRLKANDFAVRVNDGAIVTDNNSTMPLVYRLDFGFNGHIRKLQYFPSAEEL